MGKFYEEVKRELIVYARQLAWLHSVPHETDEQGSLSNPREKKKPVTRGESMGLILPDVGVAEYLVGYWHEIGVVATGAMGPVPISAKDLYYWQEITSIELDNFESSSIIEMSRAYVTQYNQHDDDGFPPYVEPQNQLINRKVEKTLHSLFGGK